MLTLSHRQMQAAAAPSRAALRLRIAALVGTACSPDPLVAADRVLEHAHNFGIDQVHDIARLARCLAVIGLDFWHDPALAWAGKILGDADMDGTRKVALLDGHIALLLRIDAMDG